MASPGPPGSEHHTSTPAQDYFAALQHQTWTHRWLAAIVGGGGAGLLANLIIDWPITVVIAVVTVAGLLLWDKRYGMLAGWWPTDQDLNRFAAIAARMERRGWAILPIPSPAPQDHPGHTFLFIGPGGVFVVEHQVWSLTDTVITSSATGLLFIGGQPVARRTASVRATTATVHTALADTLPAHHTVRAILAINGQTLHQPLTTASVTITPITDLAHLLQHSNTTLSQLDIATVTDTARRLFTTR